MSGGWHDTYWPGPLRDVGQPTTIAHAGIYKDPKLRPYLRAGRYLTAIVPAPGGSRFYVPPQAWGHDDQGRASEMLADMGALGPIRGTPAATGTGWLLDLWREDRTRRWVRRPGRRAAEQVKAEIVGGRIQRLQSPEAEDVVVDERDSYLQHFQRLPAGSAFRMFGEEEGPGTWFARCRVRVPRLLDLSPVCDRLARSGSRWDVRGQRFTVWLWQEEAQLLREHGGKAEILDGWSWEDWSTCTRDWCAMMERRRLEAVSQDVREALKRCYSAAIASFGSTRWYQLIRGQDALETDEPMGSPDGILNVFRRENASTRTNMVHWYSYLLMRQRLALFHASLPVAERGGLVELHSDSLRMRERFLGGYQIPAGFRVKEAR